MTQHYFLPLPIAIGVLMCTSCTPQRANYDAVTVPTKAQPTDDEFVRGRAILNASQNAYANLASYIGTIESSITTGYPGGREHRSQRSFVIEYHSPDNLQFQGLDSNNDPIVIKYNGQTVHGKHYLTDDQFATIEEALYAYGGITLDGSLFLPGCLLEVAWTNEGTMFPRNRSYLSAWATKAKVDGTEQVDGNECHRILCERETITFTIYVDTKSELLRRVDYEVSEAQMQRLRSFGEGGGASGRVTSMRRSQVFGITDLQWKSPGE
jgi:hypothetical protein